MRRERVYGQVWGAPRGFAYCSTRGGNKVSNSTRGEEQSGLTQAFIIAHQRTTSSWQPEDAMGKGAYRCPDHEAQDAASKWRRFGSDSSCVLSMLG